MQRLLTFSAAKKKKEKKSSVFAYNMFENLTAHNEYHCKMNQLFKTVDVFS